MRNLNKKGITLISLVITIIVLLILAGVSIAMLTGENGILSQAQRAKTETENAQAEEEKILANYESILNSYSGENTEFTDSLGNKVVVPAGFRVVNPEDNVEDGIVIEDVIHGATAGSQFVWIPVGDFKKQNEEVENINLERYSFDSTTGEPSVYNGIYTEDTKEEHVFDNTPAKDINGFISKAKSTGGYYIGRYEARTNIERKSREDELMQVTLRQENFVYNYVTQLQAASLSRNMYNDNNFTSDLINSYAWDTAIVFLQKCDNREDKTIPYSLQTSLNSDFAPQGTNKLEKKDEICNIYDMASNCYEWTTETSYDIDKPCVPRGGIHGFYEDYTSDRYHIGKGISHTDYCFRPIIYL